jgi:hypothetical protein
MVKRAEDFVGFVKRDEDGTRWEIPEEEMRE